MINISSPARGRGIYNADPVTTLTASRLLKSDIDLVFGKKSILARKVKFAEPIVLFTNEEIIDLGIKEGYSINDNNISTSDFAIRIEYFISKKHINYKTSIPECEDFHQAMEQAFPEWKMEKIENSISFDWAECDLKTFKDHIKSYAALASFYLDYANGLDIIPSYELEEQYA
jgi:hypothetical protein